MPGMAKMEADLDESSPGREREGRGAAGKRAQD